MRVDLLSLFPQMFAPVLGESILGRAQNAGLLTLNCVDIRDFTEDRHRTVDDAPYGGGAGMVMKVDVVVRAIEAVVGDEGGPAEGRVIALMSAAGQRFEQATAHRLAGLRHLVLVAGHYEGVDARVEDYVDALLSIGDYVLTGGELAAMVVVDAVARLLPGVVGNHRSIENESHEQPRLEYPQFTRPLEFAGDEVPAVLRSGNHAHIAAWRQQRSVELTLERRPDLVQQHPLRPLELDALCGKTPRRRSR